MKNFKVMRPYLQGSIGFSFLSLLCALLSTGSKLAIPYLAGLAVNRIVANPSAPDISLYLILMGIFLIVGTFFRYLFDYLTALVGQRVIKKMRVMVFASYLDAPISYIDQSRQGDLVLRLVNDVENVQNGLVSGFAALYDGIIAIGFTLVFMFIINWALALIVIVFTPISILVSRGVSRFNSQHFKAQAQAAGAVTSFALESLNNSETVCALDITALREKDFDAVNEGFRQHTFKANLGASVINPTTRLVNAIINAALIIVGAILIIYTSSANLSNWGLALAIGDLAAFITYASNYMQPFNEISDVVSEIDYALASFRRIDEAVHITPDSNKGTGRIVGPIEGLEANHVTFSYDGKRIVTKDFSLVIFKGHKIALVGPTGCGKTTLINLLMRFYDPQSGAFYVNGVSTQDLEKKAFRAHLGMVLQDTWIFAGTVYDNIAYAKPEATREEVILAAQKAQADGFIERLPQGYETPISDSSGLSVGEKQLICVARVMLLQPEIVILDEATSNIDVRTEAILSKSFDTLMAGKTSIVVAHRLSTIVSSDLIVVMKEGAIIEEGNHAELMAMKGFYYSLFNAQFS
jgi:ATP-binding cassette subfamily B protein